MKIYKNSDLNARAFIAEISNLQEKIAALREMLHREGFAISNNGVVVDNEELEGHLDNAIGSLEGAFEEIIYTE